MPALGMAQETGKIIAWLKPEGAQVTRGEPILEVETDKAAVEIEAPADGFLRGIAAGEGAEVPVGHTIAWILRQDEALPEPEADSAVVPAAGPTSADGRSRPEQAAAPTEFPQATPVARRMAHEHQLDLSEIKADGGRITRADVSAYLAARGSALPDTRLAAASPKARRLARAQGLALELIPGSGPQGAVLAADVQHYLEATPRPASAEPQELSTLWRVMAERVTRSWQSVPHFYLLREVQAGRLQAWRQHLREQRTYPVTVTDLLVRLVAYTLRRHPAVNARWEDGRLLQLKEINVGLAVAVEDGLVVPVIQRADELTLAEISSRRQELVQRAQAHRLRPADLEGSTFTISNLGMYGVDIFNAIVNQPNAAILAVGRIAERVVALDGQPVVRPVMYLSVSYDHRVVDGARGARFLADLADLIEEPLGLVD
jgi:pyruvate dehydrogenase E2 component (dihydrolipoyllysine-residue acetyltransferase)